MRARISTPPVDYSSKSSIILSELFFHSRGTIVAELSPKMLTQTKGFVLVSAVSLLLVCTVSACAGSSVHYDVKSARPANLAADTTPELTYGEPVTESKRAGFRLGETQHEYPLVLDSRCIVRTELSAISEGQDYDLYIVDEHGRHLYDSRTMGNLNEFIQTGFLVPGTYNVTVLNYRGDASTKAYKLDVSVYHEDREAVRRVRRLSRRARRTPEPVSGVQLMDYNTTTDI